MIKVYYYYLFQWQEENDVIAHNSTHQRTHPFQKRRGTPTTFNYDPNQRHQNYRLEFSACFHVTNHVFRRVGDGCLAQGSERSVPRACGL